MCQAGDSLRSMSSRLAGFVFQSGDIGARQRSDVERVPDAALIRSRRSVMGPGFRRSEGRREPPLPSQRTEIRMIQRQTAFGSALFLLSIAAEALYPGADPCTHTAANALGLGFLTLGAMAVGLREIRRAHPLCTGLTAP